MSPKEHLIEAAAQIIDKAKKVKLAYFGMSFRERDSLEADMLKELLADLIEALDHIEQAIDLFGDN